MLNLEFSPLSDRQTAVRDASPTKFEPPRRERPTIPSAPMSAPLAAAPSRALSIVRRLVILVIVGIVPVLIFASFMIIRFAQLQRAGYEQQLLSTTDNTSDAIDAEISRQIAILMTLRSTRSVQNHAWNDVYDIAKAAIADQPGARITVIEPSGQILLTTIRPFGSVLPRTNAPEDIDQVIATKSPVISNLFTGAVSKETVISVHIPVIENDQVAHVLSLTYPPDRLSRVLHGQQRPEGTIGVLIDRNGKIIARTSREEEFRGKLAARELVTAARFGERGIFEVRTLEGLSIYDTFIKSPITNWTTAIGIEKSVLDAQLRQTLWLFAAGGAALLSFALLFALLYGRTITQPIAALSSIAKSLGRGEKIPVVRLNLKEAQVTADQMRLAAFALEQEKAKREALFASIEQQVADRTRELVNAEARSRRLAVYSRSLIEASLDPLVTVSPEGKITDVNEATINATGVPRTQLTGSDFASYFTEPEKARAAYEQVFSKGMVIDYPLVLKHVSGRFTDVLYNASVYHDETGNISGVFAAARDITARKQAEVARERADRALRMLNACNTVIIHATDENNLLADVCRSVVEIGGYRLAWIGYAEEDAAKSVRPVAIVGFDKDYVDNVCASWANNEHGRGPTGTAIRTGHISVIRDMASDPAFVPWRTLAIKKGYRSSAGIPLRSGNKVYGALSVYSDLPNAFDTNENELLTELANDLAFAIAALRTKVDRDRALQELQHLSRYARTLIETSLDPLVTINAEGKITDVNKATEEATGLPREQLIDTDFAEYFTEPNIARAGYRQVFAKGTVTDYPLVLRHVSGKVMNVLYNASIYRDEKGNVAGVFAAARDVTERKKAEDELAKHREHLQELVDSRTAELRAANDSLTNEVAERTRAQAQLQSTNNELEAFSYSVSHDLRTPLRAIDGFSQILLEDYAGKLDAEGKRVLGVVRQSTVKMSQLIDDILAFSRIGRQELTVGDVDMNALVQEAWNELESARAGRVITFEVKPLPHTVGDTAMLRRVWINLLDNAIKFTAPKSDARIDIGTASGKGETVYFVRDNGVGFDMQYVGKLFGVFQRLHGQEEFRGTGIGLAIVKRIITRHDGRVWAEGKVNEGATLYFALPIKEQGDA